ncbi:hypothetical protein QWZ08_25015 [Ferruginibacter paludis]|uniref:hypothetical protein n=1 Tax=Ferruginibacter paludis TaxID=1310417 RepID=UPI0025B60DC6|nr:hypothetical protein [Ferruginibacter paludis]MDN3658929.1 hypothetical protein [Ferruginibacter paludis]
MNRLEKIKLLKALSAGQIKLEDIFPKHYRIYIHGSKPTEFFINDKPVEPAYFYSSLSITSNGFKEMKAVVRNRSEPDKT